MSKADKIKIQIKIGKTATKLITELQALHFRDPAINVKMTEVLRKLADGIESGQVGITKLSTTTELSADGLPAAQFSISFFDREHDLEGRDAAAASTTS